MPTELLVFAFAITTGFVASGLISSLYQLLTDQPASFQAVPEGVFARLAYVPVIVFGGPSILLRNAVRARSIEGREMSWIMATFLLSSGWSFVSGLVVLRIVV